MCSWLNLFALRYKNGNQKKDMQYNGQEKFEDTKRAVNLSIYCQKKNCISLNVLISTSISDTIVLMSNTWCLQSFFKQWGTFLNYSNMVY
jgi:hypothetical protein